MITRIDASNYRCFEQLAIDLGAFAVIAGANGSGKSTLLDIPLLIGDLLRADNVSHAFLHSLLGRGARAGSLSELSFRSDRESFTLAIEASLPEARREALIDAAPAKLREAPERQWTHIRYELRLLIEQGRQLKVRNEHVFLFARTADYEAQRLPIQAENTHQDDWRFILQRVDRKVTLYPEKPGARALRTDVEPSITALPLIKYQSAAEFEATRWFFELLTQRAVFFDPTWPALRNPAPPGQPATLISSGTNLPWLARGLQHSDPARFAMWVRHVRVALPQLTGIDIEEHPDNHQAWFKLSYEGGHAVTSSGLSEGTLRILALTLLPYLPEPPGLTVVEEPENAIHPQAIEAILDALRSIWGRQVWLSTHSPVVLATRTLSEVVITRLGRDGAATAVRGTDHPLLAQWKGALDLGTLYATGVFE